jgi:fumarylpyruvate hydrolase
VRWGSPVFTGSKNRTERLSANLHHEVELVLAIGRYGICARPKDAASFICGYTVGIDLTQRDMQDTAKATRRPWDFGKSFVGASPVGPLSGPDALLGPNVAIRLEVNGELRQQGAMSEIIWKVEEIIADISTC